MIVNDNSGGISYDLELSISVVNMFIVRAANCGITYEHELDHNNVHSMDSKLWCHLGTSCMVVMMFIL